MGSGASAAEKQTFAELPDMVSKTEFLNYFGHDSFPEKFINTLMNSEGMIPKSALMRHYDTDVFLTHDWGHELGQDNHARVAIVNGALKERGLNTWFDAERMEGNIKKQMTTGIDGASCILVFITKRYMEKVSGDNAADNCQLEFGYAARTKTRKLMLGVVMEERMRDASKWTGELGLELGGHLYVDMSGNLEDKSYLNRQADLLFDAIIKIIGVPVFQLHNLAATPSVGECVAESPKLLTSHSPRSEAAPVTNHKLYSLGSAGRVKAKEFDGEVGAEGGGSAPRGGPMAPMARRESGLSHGLTRPLSRLNVTEVVHLLNNLRMLPKDINKCKENLVDGKVLLQCEALEDVLELGIEAKMKAKVLLREIVRYKHSGVPLQELELEDAGKDSARSANHTPSEQECTSDPDSTALRDLTPNTAQHVSPSPNADEKRVPSHVVEPVVVPQNPPEQSGTSSTASFDAPTGPSSTKPSAHFASVDFNEWWSPYIMVKGMADSVPHAASMNGTYILVPRIQLSTLLTKPLPEHDGSGNLMKGDKADHFIYVRSSSTKLDAGRLDVVWIEFERKNNQWVMYGAFGTAAELPEGNPVQLSVLSFDCPRWLRMKKLAADSMVMPSLEEASRYNYWQVAKTAGGPLEESNTTMITPVHHSIIIAGVMGDNGPAVNGAYDPVLITSTVKTVKGDTSTPEPGSKAAEKRQEARFLCYMKREGGNVVVEFNVECMQWQIKPLASKGTNSASVRLDCLPQRGHFSVALEDYSFCPNFRETATSGIATPKDGLDSSSHKWRVFDGSSFIEQQSICVGICAESVIIKNCGGPNGSLINGIYDVEPLSVNDISGHSNTFRHHFYVRRGSRNICLEYNSECRQWQLKPLESRGTNNASARMLMPYVHGVAPSRADWAKGTWRVYDGKEFVPQHNMSCTAALNCDAFKIHNIPVAAGTAGKTHDTLNGMYVAHYDDSDGEDFPCFVRVSGVEDEKKAIADFDPATPCLVYRPPAAQWQLKPLNCRGTGNCFGILNNAHMEFPDVATVRSNPLCPSHLIISSNEWRIYDAAAKRFVNQPQVLISRKDLNN